MTTTIAQAFGRAAAPSCGKTSLIERRLRRFHLRYQGDVRALADRHPRLADLAVSFPALLFKLAAGQAPAMTAQADRVIAGVPLAVLATATRLPLWLRKLPPEAFARAIPRLPDGELVSRQIANHLPRSPKLAPVWLRAVADAYEIGNEALAVWIARELRRGLKPMKLKGLRLVCLWAWHCDRPEAEARGTIELRWQSALSFDKALSAARQWHRAVALHLELGGQPVANVWLLPGSADGFDIQPIRSAQEVMAEAVAMRNCLREYGSRLAHNSARLWSVCRDGHRIATLELAHSHTPDPQPRIVQLKAARNRELSPEVWWAVRRWLNAQDLSADRGPRLKWNSLPLDRATWTGMWRPYWLTKRDIPGWLPLKPCRDALYDL